MVATAMTLGPKAWQAGALLFPLAAASPTFLTHLHLTTDIDHHDTHVQLSTQALIVTLV